MKCLHYDKKLSLLMQSQCTVRKASSKSARLTKYGSRGRRIIPPLSGTFQTHIKNQNDQILPKMDQIRQKWSQTNRKSQKCEFVKFHDNLLNSS